MSNALRGLYVLTDERVPLHHWKETTEACLRGGARIIQLREKASTDEQLLDLAMSLQALCNDYQALFIINDRLSLAKQIKAHGIHIGANDIDLRQARTVLGKDTIIGVSCYNQLQRAQIAQSQGADYVAFGSVFKSNTKPLAVIVSKATLQNAIENLTIPVCAIGGIDTINVTELITLKIPMLAVSNSVFAATDPQSAARKISSLWD